MGDYRELYNILIFYLSLHHNLMISSVLWSVLYVLLYSCNAEVSDIQSIHFLTRGVLLYTNFKMLYTIKYVMFDHLQDVRKNK